MDEYKIISSKPAFKSAKVQVDSREVKLPNGKVVEWNVVVWPDLYTGVPIRNGKVLMVREWRNGPGTYLTQFTGARAIHQTEEENLDELRREQKEELGLVGGTYKKIFKVSMGPHITGFKTVYWISDFTLEETNRDEDEIQDILELPIKGLYNELVKNHVTAAETLLVAKLLEEQYNV